MTLGIPRAALPRILTAAVIGAAVSVVYGVVSAYLLLGPLLPDDMPRGVVPYFVPLIRRDIFAHSLVVALIAAAWTTSGWLLAARRGTWTAHGATQHATACTQVVVGIMALRCVVSGVREGIEPVLIGVGLIAVLVATEAGMYALRWLLRGTTPPRTDMTA